MRISWDKLDLFVAFSYQLGLCSRFWFHPRSSQD
ncbi:hypothetical protein LEMLEM_LOCUS16267 [Lemmus lemmus]